MEILLNGPLPPLRQDLEISPVVHDGQQLVLLSDILGLRPESVVVSPSVILVASLFDGRRRTNDVMAELAKQKIFLGEAEIRTVVEQLDKHGLLETPETRQDRQRWLDDFRRSRVRRLPLKTRGLPENPLDLAVFLGRFYKDAKGPGNAATASGRKPPLGLVSPHIDFPRGGPLYAWSYNELAKGRPPDVIVALGVAHFSPRSPWVMTQKSYETPFGPLDVDESLYREVVSTLWYDPLEEEWVHAREHSLEFQALWLKYIWRNDAPKWVPILCSSYERFCADRPPSAIPTIEGAIQKVGEILSERSKRGQRVMILAGIDLAHVGKRFGDEMEVTDDLRKKIEAADRASLDSALKLDADSFFMKGIGEGAWRKVCGLSALYTSLRWTRAISPTSPLNGRLLGYDQAPDPAGGIVSFVSAVFDSEPDAG